MSFTRLAVLLALALPFGACASTTVEGTSKGGYDFGSVQKVAIVDGEGSKLAPGSREVLADSFAVELMKRGWNLVERGQIQKAIDELNFQNSDVTSGENRQQLAQILNVQAIVILNVPRLDDTITVSAKMVEAETGDLLWVSTGQGELNTGLSTTVGALTGAAIGAVAGGEHAGTGAAIGGLIGGTAGYALSPDQMEATQELVLKMCESLPARGLAAVTTTGG